MTQREEEKIKERIRNGLGKSVTDDRWSFRGTSFVSNTYWGIKGSSVSVNFTATFHSVKAIVNGEFNGLPNCENIFTGENALSDAIMWAADKYWEMHQIVVARVAPFVPGRDLYNKAWEGRI